MKHVGFGGEAEPVDEDLRAAWRSKLEREGGLATAVYVSLSLRRPLLLEGEVGAGKTEIAKVLASVLGRSLIRLQCYEGIDTSQALYEWDYARQLLHIRALSEPVPRTSRNCSGPSSCWRCCRTSRSASRRSARSRLTPLGRGHRWSGGLR
jgi:MoxR-like ATPase